MILSYDALREIVNQGVITADLSQVNGASIDVTLAEDLLIESKVYGIQVDLGASPRQYPHYTQRKITEEGYLLYPGDFLLAHTVETFRIPNNICAVYRLNSSLARAGLNHALAGFINPGWHSAPLTLELKNWTQHHNLRLKAGMKIGHVIFSWVNPVPNEQSYFFRGSYNNQDGIALAS